MRESGVAVIEKEAVLGNLQQDAEATIPGFALQQHFSSLAGFLSHPSAILRQATLQLVGTLQRQGMVSPLDVIAHLIAMQGDIDAKIRDEALTILQVIDERHPTFLGNRMLDGIEQGYTFQLRALSHCSAVHATSCEERISVFDNFYSTCVQSPKRRREFLDGLLGRAYGLLTRFREQVAQCPGSFDLLLQEQAALKAAEEQRLLELAQTTAGVDSPGLPQSSSIRSSSSSRRQSLPSLTSPPRAVAAPGRNNLVLLLQDAFRKPTVCDFMVNTLAYLPYDAVEEPLQVVYYINRNVTVGASLLLYRLKQQFLAMGGELRKTGGMQPPVLGSRPKASRPLPAAGSPGRGGTDHTAMEREQELLLNEDTFLAWLRESAVTTTAPTKAAPSQAQLRLTELTLLTLQLRCYEGILRLKSFLKAAYGLSDERCLAFSPEDRSNAPLAGGDKLAMGVVSQFHAYPAEATALDQLFTPESLMGAEDDAQLIALMRSVAIDHNRVAHLINNDASDFTPSVSTSMAGKRKRRAPAASKAPTPVKGRRGRPPAAEKGKKGQQAKKKARKARLTDDDSDEEDEEGLLGDSEEDAEWEE